jgi:hypothetical protein
MKQRLFAHVEAPEHARVDPGGAVARFQGLAQRRRVDSRMSTGNEQVRHFGVALGG